MIAVPARVVIGFMISVYLLSSMTLVDIMNLSIVNMVRHNTTNSTLEGEFDWSEQTQGIILSAFYWGYLVLQLPTGRLADIIGGRRILGYVLLLTSLTCATIPPLARQHYGFLVAARALQGLFMGMRYPALSVVFCRWVPQEERARFLSILLLGPTLGSSALSPVWGIVISRLGWAVLFYLSAIQGLLVTILWFLLVHDSPEKHPNISSKELKYIQSGHVAKKIKSQPLPWRSIISSLQVWLPILLSISNDWANITLQTFTPKYLDSVFHLEIEQNSMVIMLPLIGCSIFSIVFSFIADYCLVRKLATLRIIRRVAVFTSHLLPALMMALFPFVVNGLVPAVVILTLRATFNGAVNAGQFLIFWDIAPNYAGTLEGLCNSFGSIAGILSPLIVGFILQNDSSASGWHIVFALTAGMYLLTSLPFICCFSGQVESWNDAESSSDASKDSDVTKKPSISPQRLNMRNISSRSL